MYIMGLIDEADITSNTHAFLVEKFEEKEDKPGTLFTKKSI